MEHLIVTDLGFGDSGKGSLVDYLARQTNAKFVVRYNGGAQAAHNVVLPDGRYHTFSQFGSATFLPEVKTILSRHTLIDPFALFSEAKALHCHGVSQPLDRLLIEKPALLITPYHREANRLREIIRGDNKHGSCGVGIGEVMADELQYPSSGLRIKDIENISVLHDKLMWIRDQKLREFPASIVPKSLWAQHHYKALTDEKIFDEFIGACCRLKKLVQFCDVDEFSYLLDGEEDEGRPVIFEGAQGVLLDEWYGFHPYTTWSTTTSANALELLGDRESKRIGAIRCYMTRHGAGPLPTEGSLYLSETHNVRNPWQDGMRYGALDLELIRYAIMANDGIDFLAMTCLDQYDLIRDPKVCIGYEISGIPFVRSKRQQESLRYQEMLTATLKQAMPVYKNVMRMSHLMETVQTYLGRPIDLTSFGPTHLKKSIETPKLAKIIASAAVGR